MQNAMPGILLMEAAISTVIQVSRNQMKIRFDSPAPYIADNIVHLPPIRHDTAIPMREADTMLAYAGHEAAHKAWTIHPPEPCMASWLTRQPLPPPFTIETRAATYHAIWNIIEDLHIEQLLVLNYPGISERLDVLRQEMTARLASGVEDTAGPGEAIHNATLCLANAIGGWSGRATAETTWPRIAAFLPGLADVLKENRAEITPDPQRRHTDRNPAAMAVMSGILKLFEDQEKARTRAPASRQEPESATQPETGEGQDPCQEGDADAEANGSSTDGTGEEDADNNDGQSSTNNGETEDAGKKDRQDGDSAGSDSGEGNRDKEGADESEEQGGVQGRGDPAGPPGRLPDRWNPNDMKASPDDVATAAAVCAERITAAEPPSAPGMKSRISNTITEALSEILSIDCRDRSRYRVETQRLPKVSGIGPQAETIPRYDRLLRMLRSEMKEETRRRTRSGRFDPRNCLEIATGSPNIYRSTRSPRRTSAAVTVLVDCSGSTVKEGVIGTCLDASLGLASLSLISPNIAVAVNGYTSTVRGQKPEEQTIQAVVYTIKQHNDHPDRASTSIANMREGLLMSGTPTGTAILRSLPGLMARKEALRLLIVLTDGKANDHEVARQALQAARIAGISTVVIEINQSTNAAMPYARSMLARSAWEIPDRIEQAIMEAMALPDSAPG